MPWKPGYPWGGLAPARSWQSRRAELEVKLPEKKSMAVAGPGTSEFVGLNAVFR